MFRWNKLDLIEQKSTNTCDDKMMIEWQKRQTILLLMNETKMLVLLWNYGYLQLDLCTNTAFCHSSAFNSAPVVTRWKSLSSPTFRVFSAVLYSLWIIYKIMDDERESGPKLLSLADVSNWISCPSKPIILSMNQVHFFSFSISQKILGVETNITVTSRSNAFSSVFRTELIVRDVP